MKFNTKAVHGGQQHDALTGAVMQPIYQTSTFAIKTPGAHQDYEYSRTGNPTRNALEKALVSLENGAFAMAFGSGLAAIDAVMKLLKPGDEVLSTKDLYGGTYRTFTKIFESYGIVFHFIAMDSENEIEKYINSNTKLIWVESPTNPLLHIIDIEMVAAVSKKHGIYFAVDNTFATPYIQQPLDLGADIVMHSATKYLGGHSDVVLGALVVKDEDLAKKLYFIQNASGAICGPMDSFLVLRGIKTLHLRMQRHSENAEAVAKFLSSHLKVESVYWPGFETHPNHLTAKKQMRNFGGMVSFTLKRNDYANALNVLKKLNVFTLAESLGGVESLCGHPASMSHASMPKTLREASGITDSLIRLSVGIEDREDLIFDLKQALDKV